MHLSISEHFTSNALTLSFLEPGGVEFKKFRIEILDVYTGVMVKELILTKKQ